MVTAEDLVYVRQNLIDSQLDRTQTSFWVTEAINRLNGLISKLEKKEEAKAKPKKKRRSKIPKEFLKYGCDGFQIIPSYSEEEKDRAKRLGRYCHHCRYWEIDSKGEWCLLCQWRIYHKLSNSPS